MGESAFASTRSVIERAFTGLYGGQCPVQFESTAAQRRGALDGIDVIDAGDHWHFVTLGLSGTPRVSEVNRSRAARALDFELTFRVHKRGAYSCPEWAVSLLEDVAAYLRSGDGAARTVTKGHHFDMHAPFGVDSHAWDPLDLVGLDEARKSEILGEGTDSGMHCLVVAEDPELKPVRAPVGHLRFLQLVGITQDELSALKSWSAEPFLEALCRCNPRLVTDIERPSIRERPQIEEAIRMGIARDGSSLAEIHTDTADFHVRRARLPDGGDEVHVTLCAATVEDLQRALISRLSFGRPLRVCGPDKTLVFWPGGASGRGDAEDDSVLYLHLSPSLAQTMLRGLRPERGIYTWPELPGLVMHVLPSEIRDSHGKLLRVVG